MLESHFSEFNHRYEILASEILNLKHIVMKLQSYTLDINKTLVEERIQVLSEIPDKKGISIIEVKDDLKLREDISNMENSTLLDGLKTSVSDINNEDVTENIKLVTEEVGALEDTSVKEVAAVEDTSVKEVAAVEDTSVKEVAAVEDTSVKEVAAVEDTSVKEVATVEDTSVYAEHEQDNITPKANKNVKVKKCRKTVELNLE